MRSIGVLQNGDLKAAYAIRATSKRALSPRAHLGHRASRPSCSLLDERACGTLGKDRFRDRPL